MIKRINVGYLMIGTVLVGLLMLFSIVAAFAEDEGTIGTNPLWLFFAKLFYLMILPIHNKFWSVQNGGTGLIYGGYFFICFLYGLLIERALTLWTEWKLNK